MKLDLSTKIGTVLFKNPVLAASGTSGYGAILNDIFDVSQLGGIITKSITVKPRKGNPPPRIIETSCGMLNSIGLENRGIQYFLDENLPRLKTFKTNVIASIAGNSDEEYAMLAETLNKQVDAIEVNISCPNVKEGGMSFGQELHSTRKVVETVKAVSSIPIIVKLTPNVTRIEDFAKVCEESGADAISLVNTYNGLSIDIRSRRSNIGAFTGGLSGPAIKPLALYAVWKTAKTVGIPVIGCGGVMNYVDAIEFFMAGASFIEIGSATFREPDASLKILRGIKQFLEDENICCLNDIKGVIHEC